MQRHFQSPLESCQLPEQLQDRAKQCSDRSNQALVQIGDLESSNAELEDSNTRLEGTAAAAQHRITELEQQLQEAHAKVGLCK